MKNRYEVDGDTVRIFLNRKDGTELVTLISLESLERTKEINGTWHANNSNSSKSFYVYGNTKINGGYTKVLLHRWLLNPPCGMAIDHVNHDTLDNRIENIRIVTDAENKQNLFGARIDSQSRVRGVDWLEKIKRWRVRIQVKGKRILIGNYDDFKEAEQAAIEARSKHMPYSQEALASAGASFI